MYVSEPIIRKSTRKPQRCYWCGEPIEGEHVAWMSADDGHAETIRCHVECKAAWDRACNGPDRDYYLYDGITFGDHNRGCECMAGRCECKRDGKDGGE